MTHGRALPSWLLLLAALAAVLTGCAGGGGAGSAADQAAAGSSEEAPVEVEASGLLADTSGATAGDASGDPSGDAAGDAAGGAAAMQRAVVSTGDVQLRARDVARARAEVVRLTAAWGGTVADEQSSSGRDGRPASTTMTLRVPSERFAAAMDALAEVAELRDQSRSAEDVTTDVVDVGARVRVQERSVRRVEALLDRATSIRDLISIESDLAVRQADLDSLRSQQAYLSDQVSLSTITVSIDRRTATQVDDAGFLAGLRGGWSALGDSTVALATAAGAVLPFALLASALLVPALAARRAVRRRRVAT